MNRIGSRPGQLELQVTLDSAARRSWLAGGLGRRLWGVRVVTEQIVATANAVTVQILGRQQERLSAGFVIGLKQSCPGPGRRPPKCCENGRNRLEPFAPET